MIAFTCTNILFLNFFKDAFEYYMFHFAYYIVHQETDRVSFIHGWIFAHLIKPSMLGCTKPYKANPGLISLYNREFGFQILNFSTRFSVYTMYSLSFSFDCCAVLCRATPCYTTMYHAMSFVSFLSFIHVITPL